MQYAHVGNNFVLDFHEPGLTDVQPTSSSRRSLNGRSGAQSVFIRPVNSVTVNSNYFMPGVMGADHAFKFGGYWRDSNTTSIAHTGGYAHGALPDGGIDQQLLDAGGRLPGGPDARRQQRVRPD